MPATANAPLTRGNIAASGPESRAEVQLDYADVLRLDQGTEVCIADLARTRIRIQVALGRVHFVAFPGRQADVEIDTPNMAVHVRSEGDYSLAVHAPDSSQLTVRSGYADVYAGSGSKSVASGQAIEVKGREDPDYQLSPVAGEGAGTAGTTNATTPSPTRNPGSTPTATIREPPTSIATETGFRCPAMAGAGRRTRTRVGCLTVTADGFPIPTTSGFGWATNLGVGRLIITGDGFFTTALGAGGRDSVRRARDLSGRRAT